MHMENTEYPQNPQNKFTLSLGAKAGGLSFTATVILNLLLSLIAGVIIAIFSLSGTEAESYIALLTSPIAIAIVLTLALTVAKQPAARLLPLKTHPKYYLIGVLIVFGALFSLSQVNEYIIELFELMGYQRRASFVPDVTGWKVVPVLIVVAVIPAFMEEILFRGIILNNAEGELGSVRVILVSGFCFSLYHGSVEQTVYQFIIGCLFGFLAVRSRSLGPVILTHFINNALIIILLACGAYDENTGAMLISKGGEIALYVVSAISLIGGVVWLFLDKTPLEKGRKGGVKIFFIFAAIGIAAQAILWIAGLFV